MRKAQSARTFPRLGGDTSFPENMPAGGEEAARQTTPARGRAERVAGPREHLWWSIAKNWRVRLIGVGSEFRVPITFSQVWHHCVNMFH